MIVMVVVGLAIAAWGVFMLSAGGRGGGGRRGGSGLAYGLILGGVIIVAVAALAMFGVIRE